MKPMLGFPGFLGVLLVAAGAAFFGFELEPLERRHELLVEQSRHSARHSLRTGRDLVPVTTAQGRLSAFYAFFRGPDTLTDHLAKLHGLALHAGLEARLADYRLSEARTLKLVEYAVYMPVTGSYPQIRLFLESALDQIPVLALDQVSMRRPGASDALVQADVRFTVFLLP